MRIDDAGPRTRLLAALAAWAIAAWLLALAGMGGRIVPLPADAAALQPLPAIAEPAPGRLGPASQYAAISRRPLLSTDRRPQPFSLEPERQGDDEAKFDFVLSGVLLTPGLRMAIVQPAGGGESIRLRVGESPESTPSWRLVDLSPRAAVFEGPEGEQTLELRSYDGTADGNAAASVMRQSAAPMPDARMPGRPSPRQVDADGMPLPEADAMEDADAPVSPEQQMEAIRKRIEARREQLRQSQGQTR